MIACWISLCLLPLQAPAGEPVALVRREHSLRALTFEAPEEPFRTWPTAGSLKIPSESLAEASISFSGRFAEAEDSDPVRKSGHLSPEEILNLVQTFVTFPPDGDGLVDPGRLEVIGERLVALQPPETQEEIAEFLSALKRLREPSYDLEVALVLPSDAAVGPGEALEKARSGGTLLQLTVGQGGLARHEPTRRPRHVLRQEVSQTGAIPVIQPAIEELPLGLAVGARVDPVGETEFLRARVAVSEVVETGECERRETASGPIELPRLAERSLVTSLLLEPGQAQLAGSVEGTPETLGAEPFAIVVRVVPAESIAPAPRGGGTAPVQPSADTAGPGLAIFDVGFLLADRGGDDPTACSPGDSPREARAPLTARILLELIRRRIVPDENAGERLVLAPCFRRLIFRGTRERQEQIRTLVRELTLELARQGEVKVEVLDGTAADISRILDRVTLQSPPRGNAGQPTKTHRAARVMIRALEGAPWSARAGTTRAFVAECHGISGGSSHAEITADVEVQTAGSGIALVGTARSALDPESVELESKLDLTASTFGRTSVQTFLADFPRKGDHLTRALSPGDSMPSAVAGKVDLPAATRFGSQSALLLTQGRAAPLRVSSPAAGKSRGALVTWSRRSPSVRTTVDRNVTAVDLETIVERHRVPPGTPARLHLDLARDESSWSDPGETARSRRSTGPLLGREPELDAASVTEMLSAAVSPGAWADQTTPARIDAEGPLRLLLEHEPARLTDTLQTLRSIEGLECAGIHVELALVPPAALEASAPGALGGTGAPWLSAETYHRVLEAAGDRGRILGGAGQVATPIVLVAPHARRWASVPEILRLFVLPKRRPSVDSRTEGDSAEVEVTPLPASRWLRVDLRVGASQLLGPPGRKLILGCETDLALDHAAFELRTVAVVPDGDAVILGAHQPDSAAGPEPELVVLLRAATIRRPLRPEASPRRWLPLGAWKPFPGDPELDTGEYLFVPEHMPLLLQELLRGEHGEELGQAITRGRFLELGGNEAQRKLAAVKVDAAARERLTLEGIELWEGDVPAEIARALAGGKEEANEVLADRAGGRLRHVRLTTVGGARARLAATFGREYISGVKLVSGARQSVEALEPNIVLDEARAGFELEGVWEPAAPGATRASFHAAAGGKPDFGRAALVKVPADPTDPPGNGPAPGAPPATTVEVELPTLHRRDWQRDAELPEGRPILLESVSGRSEEGESVVHVLLARLSRHPLPE